MKEFRRIFAFVCVFLLAALCALALDLFVLRPSGVYSYTQGNAYSFQIGMTKRQAFDQLCSEGFTQVETCGPTHIQAPPQEGCFAFTPELRESNFWVIPYSPHTYLLVFRDGRVCRILGHIRRFGEMETGLSLFATERKDVFAGLSPTQIDAIVLRQQKWTRVFLDTSSGSSHYTER